MSTDKRKESSNEPIATAAETVPFFWDTKEIITKDSKGRSTMNGQYAAAPSRADTTTGASMARYVKASIANYFSCFLIPSQDSDDGQAFAFLSGVPFLLKSRDAR